MFWQTLFEFQKEEISISCPTGNSKVKFQIQMAWYCKTVLVPQNVAWQKNKFTEYQQHSRPGIVVLEGKGCFSYYQYPKLYAKSNWKLSGNFQRRHTFPIKYRTTVNHTGPKRCLETCSKTQNLFQTITNPKSVYDAIIEL